LRWSPAVPSLPLDGWEFFLTELRARIVRLVNNGFLVHDLVISPEQDGERMVQVWCTSEFSLVKSVLWWQKIGAQ